MHGDLYAFISPYNPFPQMMQTPNKEQNMKHVSEANKKKKNLENLHN